MKFVGAARAHGSATRLEALSSFAIILGGVVMCLAASTIYVLSDGYRGDRALNDRLATFACSFCVKRRCCDGGPQTKRRWRASFGLLRPEQLPVRHDILILSVLINGVCDDLLQE